MPRLSEKQKTATGDHPVTVGISSEADSQVTRGGGPAVSHRESHGVAGQGEEYVG